VEISLDLEGDNNRSMSIRWVHNMKCMFSFLG